jgi:hypothetical protein
MVRSSRRWWPSRRRAVHDEVLTGEDDAQRSAAVKAPVGDWFMDAWRSLGARR